MQYDTNALSRLNHSHIHLACCHSFPHPLSFVSAREKCGVKKKNKLTADTESARSIVQTAYGEGQLI